MLKVWLPLDGDLRNLGTSNVTVVNNGATVNNAGKIGKCYSPATITLTNLNNLSFNNSSYCFWAKTNSTTSWQLIIGIDNSDNSQIHGIYIADSTRLKLGYNPSLNIHNAEIGSWHHYAFVVKDGKSCCYCDGVLQTTSNEAVTNDTIGRLRLGVGTSIFLNDVRIYDHCLSAAEVHEIAQGLVLHYKLDNNSHRNLISANAAKTITLDETATNAYSGHWYLDPDVKSQGVLLEGTQYSVIYDYTVNTLTSTSAHMYSQINTSRSSPSLSATDIRTNTSGTIKENFVITAAQANYTSSFRFRIRFYGNGGDSVTISNLRIILGTHEECDYISDSSGYGHNGTIVNTITTSSDSPRYDNCTHMSATNQKIQINNIITSGFGNSYTIAWWGKCTTFGGKMHWGFSDGVRLNGIYNGNLWNTGDGSNNPLYKPGTTTQVTAPSTGVWHHFAMIGDGTNCKVYLDGDYWGIAKTYKSISGTSIYLNGWDSSTSYSNSDLSLSDFRIYCTPLLDSDIKLLYNSSMRVDNLGNCHTYELNENKVNLMWRPENARAAGKGFNNGEGLSAFTQANCQVTCNANGYNIYRPANLTVSNNGNTMYGGLKIRNSTNGGTHIYDATIDNIFNLQKGHTYIWIFTVNGSTENASSFQLTNYMGWGSGGLVPAPSNVVSRGTGSNFNGTQECWYKFTINDDIVKTCTSSYSAFVQGNQYLSYMDFGFYFSYQSTGTGTNLYISNIRLYDITNIQQKLNKTGIANFTSFIEENYNNKILSDGEFYGQEFIEI